MRDQIRDVATITFSGPRFEDAGLELEMLPELLAYRKLLIAIAKELWRLGNRGRRLPIAFTESIRLKIYSIEAGSVMVPIKRALKSDHANSISTLHGIDEIDEAALLIDQTITAVTGGMPVPDRMPKAALSLFGSFGKGLGERESIKTQSIRSVTPAEFNRETRQRLVRLSKTHANSLEELTATRAVHHWQSEIRDSPVAKKLLPPHGEAFSDDAYDDSAAPIWQSVIELGASLPPEEWDRVPKDLASNLDHYLYGSSAEDE